MAAATHITSSSRQSYRSVSFRLAATRAFYVLLSCILLLLHKAPICQADTVDSEDKVKYVIAISADGFVPSKIQSNINKLPNFRRLRRQGAHTDNARNEFDSSQTVPNHVSMLTGLSVPQHSYATDGDNGGTVGAESIFDWVKEAGGKTCMFATKEKFQLFSRSWPIDVFHWSKRSEFINELFLSEMTSDSPCNYALLHWRNADFAGHKKRGVNNKQYRNAVLEVDEYLGLVFSLIDNSPVLRDNTAIVLTSDHGFGGENHSSKEVKGNYQIPFYVWGKGVKGGADLYELNKRTRVDPGKGRITNDGIQPIRTQDSAVLSADWLGVGKGYADLYVRVAPLSEQIALLASLPKTESPTKAPTWPAENWPGRWSSLLQIVHRAKQANKQTTLVPTNTPTKALTNAPTSTPTNAKTNAPTSTPTNTPTIAPTIAPTKAPTRAPTNTSTNKPTRSISSSSMNTPSTTSQTVIAELTGIKPTMAPSARMTNDPTESFASYDLLYVEEFDEGNGFIGLNRISNPTSNNGKKFVGKMKVPSESDFLDAYHDAKEYGGILLQGARNLKLQAKLYIEDLRPRTNQEQIEFHLTIRTDTGETVRGEKVYLSSMDTKNKFYTYTSDVRVSDNKASSLNRVRIKVKNLSSDKVSFPNTDPKFKTNLLFSEVKVKAVVQE